LITSFPFLTPQFGTRIVFGIASFSLTAGGNYMGGIGGGNYDFFIGGILIYSWF